MWCKVLCLCYSFLICCHAVKSNLNAASRASITLLLMVSTSANSLPPLPTLPVKLSLLLAVYLSLDHLAKLLWQGDWKYSHFRDKQGCFWLSWPKADIKLSDTNVPTTQEIFFVVADELIFFKFANNTNILYIITKFLFNILRFVLRFHKNPPFSVICNKLVQGVIYFSNTLTKICKCFSARKMIVEGCQCIQIH